MEIMEKVTVQIIDPATGRPVSVKEWEKVADPTTAEAVLITNEFGQQFLMLKSEDQKRFAFGQANEMAAALGGTTGTRKQWIDIYEAIHTAGLNDALNLIGGDRIRGAWYWTCEIDSDQSHAYYAWIFPGSYGHLNHDSLHSTAAARVFRPFEEDSKWKSL